MEVAAWLECLVYVQACRCCHWDHPSCFPALDLSGVLQVGTSAPREKAVRNWRLEDATNSWRPRAERNKAYEGRAVNCDGKRDSLARIEWNSVRFPCLVTLVVVSKFVGR